MEGLNSKSRGFTIVEILIDFFVITVVAVAILTAYVAATKSITLAKSKMMAVALANEKMEMIRNMPYDNLATALGAIYPPGNVLDDELVDKNGIKFDVHTVINYVDDPFDGNATGTVAGKPVDVYPYDYKKVEITVGIHGRKSQLAKISTDVGAKAAETPTNTGILSICVVDSQGSPVDGANVEIKNITMSPIVDMNVVTGATGCVMVPKLPPDDKNDYHVVTTKDGWSVDQTYPRTAQNPNALKPDLNVIAQQVTNATFVIDIVSKIDLTFTDQAGNVVPNVSFNLSGKDLIYNNPDTSRFAQDFTTDANGHILIPNLKFDTYSINILSSDYYLISTVPTSSIDLISNSVLQVKAVLSVSSSNPAILGITPSSGVAPDNATLVITGRNLSNSSSVMLRNKSNGVEIVGTNISAKGQETLSVDFSLLGAVLGGYDLIIRNTDGQSVVQEKGFEVVKGS